MNQPSATPPPLSPSNPFAAPQTTNPVAVQAPAGSLEELVMSGHRFIVTPYVVSAVVVTFRRSLGQAAIVNGENWPIGRTFAGTFITLFGGWWGVPWGPIFSIGALWQLWNGGRDMTKQVLTSSLGAVEAKRILLSAPKPVKPPAIWGVRAVIALFIALPVALLFLGVPTSREASVNSRVPSTAPARPHRLAHPPAGQE